MPDEDKDERRVGEEDGGGEKKSDKEEEEVQEPGPLEAEGAEAVPAATQEPTDSSTISLVSEGGGGDKLLGESSHSDQAPDVGPPLTVEEQRQADREYIEKLTRSLIRSPTLSSVQPEVESPTSAISPSEMWRRASSGVESRKALRSAGAVENLSLLGGFTLLRLAQLLNFDVYYIGMPDPNRAAKAPKTSSGSNRLLSDSKQQLVSNGGDSGSQRVGRDIELGEITTDESRQYDSDEASKRMDERTVASDRVGGGVDSGHEDHSLIDELASLNPLQRYINKWWILNDACRLLKICLSLVAIMITVDKTISTILLCLLSRPDIKIKPGNIGIAYEMSDVTMSWTVLVLINMSSMFILYATVFNGHSVWRLLSQRLFLVSRQFQYKTMLSLIVFIYLEYILNASFVNNLFGWSFETLNDFETLSSISGSDGGRGGFSARNDSTNSFATKQGPKSYGIHNSYSVLSNLEIFVTEKHERNALVDILLTIMQFARGIIRMSPYITINYVIICLNEHIKTIRNQALLTDSLKKRQKLRMVVKSRQANMIAARGGTGLPSAQSSFRSNNNGLSSLATNGATISRKKRVIFATEESGRHRPAGESPSHLTIPIGTNMVRCEDSPSPISLLSSTRHTDDQQHHQSPSPSSANTNTSNGAGGSDQDRTGDGNSMRRKSQAARNSRPNYLSRIRDFDELESYVTNLYIFTGRLNRLMSQQGLAMFFIVHNLIITCTLIVPEAISGGPPMVLIVRILVIVIGIIPFISGQSLNGQLDQLSKQIDRIIIHQKFISRKRDNLVRIRELLHDIRVNCGGMLNFNVETGIKYLVVAFASAFFIEQEGKSIEEDALFTEHPPGSHQVGQPSLCNYSTTNPLNLLSVPPLYLAGSLRLICDVHLSV